MAGSPDQGIWKLKGLNKEEDNTASGPTGASEIYEKQGEDGSAPTVVLGHAETLCHLKRNSISKQLKNFA